MAAWAASLALLAGCAQPEEASAPFTLGFAPAAVGDVVPGQLLLLMVTAESDDEGPVVLSASVNGEPVAIEPAELAPGGVAELSFEIEERYAGTTLHLEVRGERGTEVEFATLDANVAPSPGEPPLETATEVRDQFVRWLARERPDLGIDESTTWQATVARPIWLVVSYYTFYTDEWEMGVRWHIMVPPYDWSEIYLRERYEEAAPSLAWKIDSRSSPDQEPHPVTPEPDVWR